MNYQCRYCLDDNLQWMLIKPCLCSGTNSCVHISCLVKWLWVSSTFHCPVCKTDFKNRDMWYIITQVSYVCNILLEFGVTLYNIIFKP